MYNFWSRYEFFCICWWQEKDIFIFGEGPTNGLDVTILTAEKKYSINFCLRLHYIGANNCLFVNGTEIVKFKAKDSEIVATTLSLGNISKDFSVDNIKKTGLNGNVYDL